VQVPWENARPVHAYQCFFFHGQYLLVGGLEHFGFFMIFPYIGNFIIPTDELIIFRGVGLNHQPVISCFINMLVILPLLLDGRDCIRNSDGAIGIPSSFMCIFVPCLMIIVLLKMFIRIIWVICFKMLLWNMAHLVTVQVLHFVRTHCW
jgi:hypothetical protein